MSVAVVTGGASGIGAAVVAMLRDQHWSVVVADRDAESSHTDSVLGVPTDVTDEDDVARLAQLVETTYGRTDAVITCAGIADNAPLRAVDAARFSRTLAVNVVGTFAVCRAFVDQLAASRGAIVTVGSVSGARGSEHRAAYSASKGAVAALTRQLAVELADEGVRANCVAPGSTDTPLAARAQAGTATRRSILEAIPLGRRAQPREIAEVITFLAGPSASFVTGQIWGVDGGQLSYGGWRTGDSR